MLGPILFSIYINNIVNAITGCLIHLYADDAILYCIADTVDDAIGKLQLSFNALQYALIKLKLVINDSKPNYCSSQEGMILIFLALK